MSDELKERIENLISYYNNHSMVDMVEKGGTLRGFVTDDFSHLLKALEKELEL